MNSLIEDLQTKKTSLVEFKSITTRILDYLPNVISTYTDHSDYRIFSSNIANTQKYVRPVNIKLFIFDSSSFSQYYEHFDRTLNKLKNKQTSYSFKEKQNINKVLYTIQQSIGAGLDLLGNPNSNRKHVGNRFEELIKCVFDQINISNKRIVLSIPYETESGKNIYKCENDLILSPFESVKSNSEMLSQEEIVLSI